MAFILRDRETIFFQNQAGSVIYNSAGYAHLAWSSNRLTLPDLQAFYEHTLQLLANTGASKILSDHGQRQPLPADAQHWLTTNWLPRAIPLSGTLYCAIVDGSNPMHRLSTTSVILAAPTGALFNRFDNIPQAETWLLSV